MTRASLEENGFGKTILCTLRVKIFAKKKTCTLWYGKKELGTQGSDRKCQEIKKTGELSPVIILILKHKFVLHSKS